MKQNEKEKKTYMREKKKHYRDKRAKEKRTD